ncbi:MAG: phosphomannomutase, partial [Candidatus Paceibacteria bacterium]
MREGIFGAYDVRGIWQKDLDEEIVKRIGWAAGEFFKKISGKVRPVIWVGEDSRKSSPKISGALMDGLYASDVAVRFGGKMT